MGPLADIGGCAPCVSGFIVFGIPVWGINDGDAPALCSP